MKGKRGCRDCNFQRANHHSSAGQNAWASKPETDRVRGICKGEFNIIPATRSVRELNGMLYRKGRRPVTIEEMNEAIAKAAADLAIAGKNDDRPRHKCRGSLSYSRRPTQTAKAIQMLNPFPSDSPGFISLIVLAESVWVFNVSFGYKGRKSSRWSKTSYGAKELVIEQAEFVSQALQKFHEAATTSPIASSSAAATQPNASTQLIRLEGASWRQHWGPCNNSGTDLSRSLQKMPPPPADPWSSCSSAGSR